MEAAFFDLDKTVIAKASMAAFGRSFYREGLISRRLVARSIWAQVVYMHLGASEEKLARMRESVLALTKGWEHERVRSIVAEALQVVIEPIIYSEALDLIELHRAAGRLVCIVSASPVEIVDPLGGYLGADHVIASRAEVDDDGRYTGRMDRYAYGPFKAAAMRDLANELGIDLAASYGYSDSFTDLPMLEAVGHPVVVNPDRDLARAARQRGWEVRHFVRPVRLRDRVPVPPAAPTAAGGVVAALAVGTFVWWRLRTPDTDAPGLPPARGGRASDAPNPAIRRAASWRR